MKKGHEHLADDLKQKDKVTMTDYNLLGAMIIKDKLGNLKLRIKGWFSFGKSKS